MVRYKIRYHNGRKLLLHIAGILFCDVTGHLKSFVLYRHPPPPPHTHTARNLGVTLNSQPSLTANITATTCPCRFMLHNVRRIRPFSLRGRHRFWSRLWSRLWLIISSSHTYTIATPSWQVYLLLPSGPLHLILKAVAPLVLNLNSLTLLRSLHCYQWQQERRSTHLPPQTKDTSLQTTTWIKTFFLKEKKVSSV